MIELCAGGKKAKEKGRGTGAGSGGGKSLSKSYFVACLKKSLKSQKHWISTLNTKIWETKQASNDNQSLSCDNNLEGKSTSNRGHPMLTQDKRDKQK